MFQSYLWVTGTTETARNHCKTLSNLLIAKSNAAQPRVLEIGSNDGTLLGALVQVGAKEVIGVDPAANLQQKNPIEQIKLIEGFFDQNLANSIAVNHEKFDVVVARNVLSHVPDLRDVMDGIKKIIHPDGIISIEFHEASKILTELHYESIYHEHTFYHSIKSIQAALSQIGFTIFDLTHSPISGGSFVIYASQAEREPSKELQLQINLEEKAGVYSQESWEMFAVNALQNLQDLRDILNEEKGESWSAFGASARSSTLLNSIGDSAKTITAIADNNPLKQGKLSPGLNIPILSPMSAITSETKKVLVCAFNFEDEILDCLRNEIKWKGEVILPLPHSVRRYQI
jgi:SAM-dependent methyltransferase